jgi:hypothetical protein
MGDMNFVLLAIGNPGNSGTLSLKSILSIKPDKICVMADDHGEKWLQKFKFYTEFTRNLICIHKVTSKDLEEFEIVSPTGKFQNYGNKRFNHLTILKWVILKKAIEAHVNSKTFFFTDLDVLWFKPPNAEFLEKNVMFVQNDPNPNSKKTHYCTGIMFWQSNQISLNLLSDLTRYQNLNCNNDLHDEQIFNLYFEDNKSLNTVRCLDSNLYPVGSQARHLLLRKSKNLKKLVAFHANYFVGDKNKTMVMKAILAKKNRNITWSAWILKLYIHLFARKYSLVFKNKVLKRSTVNLSK